MATVPTPRSYNQIIGHIINAFLSKYGIPTLITGTPLLSTFEAAAQSDLRTSQDIFEFLDSTNLDNAEGIALDRIGADEEVFRFTETPANTIVTISDTSFTKISSKVFQGSAAPIIGTIALKVADGSAFPTTGSVYIGRGTNNYEGPLTYTSRVNSGGYWTINLTVGTSKFHNVGETVILAQGGNRSVSAGTVVQTPQANVTNAVKYTVQYTSTLVDGEVVVLNVPVICQTSGIIGNCIAGQIKEFASLPFTGAVVTNPLPVSNGLPTEVDDDYRERIRAARQSRTRGTALALKTFTTGITAPDENKRVLSSSVVTRTGYPTTIYIDDGTGYEERDQGIALEILVDQALGGENDLQLNNRPIAKATVVTTITSPFALSAGMKLRVSGFEHTFNADEFRNIGNSDSFEVVSSINADSTFPFSARVVESGSKFAVFAKADTNESVEVELVTDGLDANTVFQFPLGRVDTLRLYKNDRLLSKDGTTASIVSNSFTFWDSFAGPQTIILAVDSTPALTYTFVDQDFIDAQTVYNQVGKNSIDAWVAVFNNKIPGITATNTVGKMTLTSNLGPNKRGSISVIGGDLVTGHMFTSGTSLSTAKDYTLDRNLGQIHLSTSLVEDDRLTAGSTATRAFLESGTFSTVNVTSPAKFWFSLDGNATIVPTGISNGTTLALTAISAEGYGYRFRISSTLNLSLFGNVLPGDRLIIWDSAFATSLRNTYRVAAVDTTAPFTYVDIERQNLQSAHSMAGTVALSATKILVCGGWVGAGQTVATATTEIYDTSTQLWTAVRPMNVARAAHTATLLPSGKVLVTGGTSNIATVPGFTSVEIYDPVADTWTTETAMTVGRFGHTATLINGGTQVFIVGGYTVFGTDTGTATRYNIAGNTYTAAASLTVPRGYHSAAVLASGDVLILGGTNVATTSNSVELYSVGSDAWTTKAPMATGRSAFALVSLTGPERILVMGGSTVSITGLPSFTSISNSVESYDVTGDTWTTKTSMGASRSYFTAIAQSNTRVLALFGNISGTKAEAYNVTGNTWAALPTPLSAANRIGSSAVGLVTEAVVIGGFDSTSPFRAQASSEAYVYGSDVWVATDPTVSTSVALAEKGMAFVRTTSSIKEVVIPIANQYTTYSLISLLEDQLKGAESSVYRTTKTRINTDTFDLSGDIALVAQDVQAAQFQLSVGNYVDNLTGHIASVQSGASELGTPDFHMSEVRTNVGSGVIEIQTDNATYIPSVSGQVVGLKSSDYSSALLRFGSNTDYHTSISNVVNSGTVNLITLENEPYVWLPSDRLYFAAPYGSTARDTFSILVDQDIDSKMFNINMFRNITPTTTTYGASNTFSDGDSGGTTGASFGLDFNFTDFAVYMKARTKTHDADATKRILWRFWRHGAEGNWARLRYAFPSAALAPISVVATQTSSEFTDISVGLPGGAAKVGYTLRGSTRIGVDVQTGAGLPTVTFRLGFAVSSATRDGSNNTTLTLTLGSAAHGFVPGNVLWLQSTNPQFTSGSFIITAVAPGTITFNDANHGTGATTQPNIGTVTFDPAGEGTLSSMPIAVVAGDLVRIASTSGLASQYTDRTVSIATFGAQFLTGKLADYSGSTLTTTIWYPLTDLSAFSIFANGAATATVIATAVNALFNVPNSTCPVSATVIGSGSGTITLSSDVEAGVANTFFTLTDGVNWIATYTAPINIASNYTFTFKNPVNSSLALNSDWLNENVRLGPVTTQNLVDWLNSPAISGIFANTEIVASDDALRLQIASSTIGSNGSIQVQSGSANTQTAAVVGAAADIATGTFTSSLFTVDSLQTIGITGQNWISIDNEIPSPKALFGFGSGTVVNSITADGTVTLSNSFNFFSIQATVTSGLADIERQGNFVFIKNSQLGPVFNFNAVREGNFVVITKPAAPTLTQVSDVNTGTYRVVRVTNVDASQSLNNGGFWIENANATEEQHVQLDLKFLSTVSVMPNDTVVINTPILGGAANQGFWTVDSVGGTTPFSNTHVIKLNTQAKSMVPLNTPVTLGNNFTLIQFFNSQPTRQIKQVLSITPNQANGSFADIKVADDVLSTDISSTYGSIVTVLDKLNFSTDIVTGLDGYKYGVGLIGEANKVVYGVASDSATYPGVASAGASINIEGPLVKRLKFSILIRVSSGVLSEIADAARSAIASVVNSSDIGKSIAISDIVAAVTKVSGIAAVTIISPTYNVSNDLISVQPFERPLILDLENDIQVSFVGE